MSSARSAPMASRPRSCCPTSLGPMLTSTTSPACSPPLPFSVRRSAVSTAYSSNGLTCQLAPERSTAPLANFSFCSGLGTRLQGTSIFTDALAWSGVLTGGEPERLFQVTENLVAEIDQVDGGRLGLPVRPQLVHDGPGRVARVHAAESGAHAGQGDDLEAVVGGGQEGGAGGAANVLHPDLAAGFLHGGGVNDVFGPE